LKQIVAAISRFECNLVFLENTKRQWLKAVSEEGLKVNQVEVEQNCRSITLNSQDVSHIGYYLLSFCFIGQLGLMLSSEKEI